MNNNVECSANTEVNRAWLKRWIRPFVVMLGSLLLVDTINFIIEPSSFSVKRSFFLQIPFMLFLEFPSRWSEWWLIVFKLVIFIPVWWFFRTKNVRLIIDSNQILYKSFLGIEHKYTLNDISYYRTATRYMGDNNVPIGYTISIHMKSKRIIWIWNHDSNTDKLFELMEENKITRKKSII